MWPSHTTTLAAMQLDGPGYSLTEVIRRFVQYNIKSLRRCKARGEASRREGRTIQLRSRQEFAWIKDIRTTRENWWQRHHSSGTGSAQRHPTSTRHKQLILSLNCLAHERLRSWGTSHGNISNAGLDGPEMSALLAATTLEKGGEAKRQSNSSGHVFFVTTTHLFGCC